MSVVLLLNNIADNAPTLLGAGPGRPGAPNPIATRARQLAGRLKKLRIGGGRGGFGRGGNGGGNLSGRLLLADAQAELAAVDTAQFLSSRDATLIMQARRRCCHHGWGRSRGRRLVTVGLQWWGSMPCATSHACCSAARHPHPSLPLPPPPPPPVRMRCCCAAEQRQHHPRRPARAGGGHVEPRPGVRADEEHLCCTIRQGMCVRPGHPLAQ